RSSVAMPMSASVFAPRTVWSSPSASTRLSQSRRSVGVLTLVSTAMSASQPLRLVVVKGTRQRPRPPTIVGYRKAVLRRQLDPDPLVASELRGRVRAGPKLGPGDVDDAVEVVAEEGGDAERPGELVRLTSRRGVDKDPFGPEDEERSRARGDGFGQRAAHDPAERPHATLHDVAGHERRVAYEVGDEAGGRRRVDVPRPALLHDAAVLHDGDPVRQY